MINTEGKEIYIAIIGVIAFMFIAALGINYLGSSKEEVHPWYQNTNYTPEKEEVPFNDIENVKKVIEELPEEEKANYNPIERYECSEFKQLLIMCSELKGHPYGCIGEDYLNYCIYQMQKNNEGYVNDFDFIKSELEKNNIKIN